MKRLQTIFLLYCTIGLKAQLCNPIYTYSINNEIVSFYNQSTANNPHYYWNFGDGTSSNFQNPIHEFPGNGTYLVTLYVRDSLTGCSNFCDKWLNITKYSTTYCYPLVFDSIYPSAYYPLLDEIKIKDSSMNCGGLLQHYQFGMSSGNGNSNSFFIPKNFPLNFVSYVSYFQNAYYYYLGAKTISYKYDRAKNYTDCSANFEFSVISKDTISQSQVILLKAMNKNATSYLWAIPGFGDPIIKTTDTAYVRYPLVGSIYCISGVAILRTTQNGCRDSLIQDFASRKKSVTSQGLYEASEPNFSISLGPNPIKDKLTVVFNNDNSKKKLTITNSLGELIYSVDLATSVREIDMTNFSAGIYYVTAVSEAQKKIFKIIKQ